MNVTGLASAAATRLKGRELTVDTRVPSTYLARLGIVHALMVIRGRVRFPARNPYPRIGRGVRVVSGGLVSFGAGVVLAEDSYIDAVSQSGVVLGDATVVGRRTRIEATGSVRSLGVGFVAGKRVGLGTDCFYGCAGGITIGDDTIVGNVVTMHSENHIADRRDIPIHDQSVTHNGISIGRDCWIGAKATILDGARIGDGSIVAAGAVVTAGDYESYGVYGGVPARRIGTRGAERGIVDVG